MRRNRQVREFRERVLRERLAAKNKLAQRTNKKFRTLVKNKEKTPILIDQSLCPINKEYNFVEFKKFEDYMPQTVDRPINVCHVIESLGLGGAQVMMFELINGLNKYFGQYSKNICVYIGKHYDKKTFSTYGASPYVLQLNDFRNFCRDNNIDVVLHHRIAISKCLKQFIPNNTKYILINHTWHNMAKMPSFQYCDVYVSVCKFLQDKTNFAKHIKDERKVVILNGVENDYIPSLSPAYLEGDFKTGRCHRMVPGKFKHDSLTWMKSQVSSVIPGFSHFLIGNNREAKYIAKKYSSLHYFGDITDRYKKMSIIKELDVYFYETFQEEGASIALLEALSCGVPVLCKALGGCPELITNSINGFIAKDRIDFYERLVQLNKNREMLNQLRISTLDDFNSRLHVKHAASKYMQMLEMVVK